MLLLDTNILSEVMKLNPFSGLAEFLNDHPENGQFMCSISRAEIELGIALLPNGKKKQALYQRSQEIFLLFKNRSLVFGDSAASEYATLVAQRRSIGRPISVEDAQIASIAIVYGLRLVTRNIRDFEHISALETINPWKQ